MNQEKKPPLGPPPHPMGLLGIVAFGIYFVVLSLLIFYVLLAIWPQGALGTEPTFSVRIFRTFTLTISDEARLLLIAILSAALGSYVHSATSFVTYVGNRDLVTSWAWWYLLRPFIGSSLALVVYFAFRGGLLSAGVEVEDISHFGVAAVSALVGMFSKEATDKLYELFTTLFKTGEQIPRKDKLGGEKPKDEKGEKTS